MAAELNPLPVLTGKNGSQAVVDQVSGAVATMDPANIQILQAILDEIKELKQFLYQKTR